MAEVFYEGGKKYNCRKKGKPYYRVTAVIDGAKKEFYGDGQKDAERKKAEAVALAAKGLNIDKKNAKVGPTFRRWLFDVKRVDRNVKASTFTRYESLFRLHIEPYPIAQITLYKLDSITLQGYLTALYEDGMTNATLASVIKEWKMFCAWATDEGYMTKNPCRNIVAPGKHERAPKTIETFSAQERRRIVAYMKDSHYQYDTVILLGFATGMRLGELLGLKWTDIQGDMIHIARSTAMVTHVDKDGNRERYREVWDTKTENSVRDIPMLPSTIALLREHKKKQYEFFGAQCEFVFTTESGAMVDHSSFRRSYQRMLERAGIPYRKFHAVRHTFATEAIRSGMNVKDLQMLMGHADIETTYIYVHANEESKRSAIAQMGNII